MSTPAGFERLLLGHAIAVARTDVAPQIRTALVGADGTRATLHEYASRQPGARPLAGRGIAYAIALPQSKTRVVIRHNRHGGLFAPLTRDRFVAPTRGPYELDVSLELARRGVPTPEVLAYAVYPPGGLLQRCDVCSREISSSRDLADLLHAGDGATRARALDAAAALVRALSRASVRHHDLNAKNVLVAPDTAYVLDVDRIRLDVPPEHALEGNLARLKRSLRKWRDRFGVAISEEEIAGLEAKARAT